MPVLSVLYVRKKIPPVQSFSFQINFAGLLSDCFILSSVLGILLKLVLNEICYLKFK